MATTDIRFLQHVNIQGSMTATSGANVPEVIGFNNKLKLTPSSSYSNTDQIIIIEPTVGDIHIRAGQIADSSSENLVIGAERTYLKVSDTSDNVTIKTTDISDNQLVWTFDDVGTITLPLTSDIKLNSGRSIITDPQPTTLNVTNSAVFDGDVIIGTTAPISGAKLSILGDVVVEGSITATGSAQFVNTVFTTTSSLSISNVGTGPALVVAQEGEQAVAAFYDHESTIGLWVDGRTARPGYVGIKTTTPNEALTVNGNISSNGIIYGSNIVNKYSLTIGDGSSNSIAVDHNLNTEDVVVSVIDKDTKEIVYPSINYTSVNTVTLNFTEAPATSSYKVIVIG